MNTPDHPVIQNMMRTGTPDGKDPGFPKCPNCGKEAENFYECTKRGIVGCDICLTVRSYYEIEI